MEQSIRALAEPVRIAGQRFPGQKRVVITGGVFRDPFVEVRLGEILDRTFCLVKPDLPPVYGSLIEAARIAGINVGKKFEENYRRTSERE
jgi:hypothetical protein